MCDVSKLQTIKLTNWTENIQMCIDCKEEKPLGEFYTNGILGGKQRYRPECKQCHNLRRMKNYVKKPFNERYCIYCGKKIISKRKNIQIQVCGTRECRYKHNRDYYYKIKNEIFDLLGGKCMSCGFSDRRILQIDHVHGGGKKEYRSFCFGLSYLIRVLEKIKSGSKDYQLLCPNHNWLKRIENKEN